MPRRIGAPAPRNACSANPTSSATSSVCSTLPSVSEDSRLLGMIPSRKSVVFWASAFGGVPCLSPFPGCSQLPTTSPITSATVDMTRK